MGGKAIQPGEKFGSLTARRRLMRNGRSHWVCDCDCGNEHVVDGGNLRNGNTRWCRECSRRYKSSYKTRHGNTANCDPTRIYGIWSKIKARVFNPKNPAYPNYGGRGIDMDPRWASSFEDFHSDMGAPPDDESQIDRIDNNKGYWPWNCRWADRFEQASNKRNNHYITVDGETFTVAEWARRTGLPHSTIRRRISYGWDDKRAVSIPVETSKQKFSYHTPMGVYPTLTDAAEAYGVAFATIARWCKDPRKPEFCKRNN